jgi:hypothetical protein
VRAANDAGGKDNVTVVYVEGDAFKKPSRSLRPIALALAVSILALAVAWWRLGDVVNLAIGAALGSDNPSATVLIVKPGQSIADALKAAAPGATILVEPGEYRERLTITGRVQLISVAPRGATLRLPGTATDNDAAIAVSSATGVEIAGFRIVGDAATPLGTGVITRTPNVRLIDLEVTGAARAAIDLGPGGNLMLASSDIHDNPGTGLAVRADASARISHNAFSANGGSAQASGAMVIEPGARPEFLANVFRHLDPRALTPLDAATRAQLVGANWFPDTPRTPGRGRQ